MKLRLYHHADGARVAYREVGAGPALALLHSSMLSYKEWEPIVEALAPRFRLVLPDLPLHGDSEQRPSHPYTREWLIDVLAGFCGEVLGPRPLLAGHELGGELLLHGCAAGKLRPERLVLMPNRMHRRAAHARARGAWRLAARAAALPGLDYLMSHAAGAAFRPELGPRLSVRAVPETRDLVRHAFADVAGNAERARAWARFAARWPVAPQRELLDAYGSFDFPVLLLWADRDLAHPLAIAEEALDVLPQAQLRVLAATGFLIAYDDPVGVARELAAFCG